MNPDDALHEWASAMALPEDAADDIFRQITRTPAPAPAPGLDPRWWARFSAQLATTIVASSRPGVTPVRRPRRVPAALP